MKKFKQHLRSYKENNEVVEQKIDQINANLNMLSENLVTKRDSLDLISSIKSIYREIHKEIMFTLRYLNELLLDVNIELTYNTLISSKVVDQSPPEEEEKKVPESQENPPSSVYDKPISVLFFTNLSSDRLNILSSKLSETMYVSNSKDKVSFPTIL